MALEPYAPVGLALVLGLRHGLDADHLAAIDGLTRASLTAGRRHASACGALFSAGHGAVIVAAAIALSLLAGAWTPPGWLEATGKGVSAAVLLALGAWNLRTALGSHGGRTAGPVGLRSSALSRLLRATDAWQIPLVGALFALSFDAFALAAFFAAAGAQLGGTSAATVIALAFAAGMVLVDGANGAWVARLVVRSDRYGAATARTMTLAVAIISVVIGGCMGASLASASLDRWLDHHELAFSALVVVTVLGGYLLARLAARATVRAAARGHWD